MNKIRLKVLLFLFFTLLFSTVLLACRFVPAGDDPSPSPTVTTTPEPTPTPSPSPTPVNQKTFAYNYRNATGNNTTASVTLYRATLSSIKLVKPEREYFTFDGWYLDNEYTAKVSDNQGNTIIGNTVFDSTSTTLFAKWTVNQQITYKVLMVFVVEVDAVLTTNTGEEIHVQHTLTETERKICEMIPPMFENIFNEMFDGLVTFEVDTYWTTEVQGRDSFSKGIESSGKWSYAIFANTIFELQDKMNNYGSVITTFLVDDYEFKVQSGNPLGDVKYASIPLEAKINTLIINGGSADNLVRYPLSIWDALLNEPAQYFFNDRALQTWKAIIKSYIHEFVHTVEMYYTYGELYNFHEALNVFLNTINLDNNYILVMKDYLLSQLIIENKKVGIPYEFWSNWKELGRFWGL